MNKLTKETALCPVIGVITPYKKYFEFWKKDKGFEKYGKDANFIMINRTDHVCGREFKAVEMGYKHNEVHVDVVNAAVVRIR